MKGTLAGGKGGGADERNSEQEGEESDSILCQDGDDTCKQPATCDCQQGAFTFNANMPNRFATNPLARSLNLNGANQQAMGPCTGFYGVPGSGGVAQPHYRIANTFFVDFPLNGVHGCSSEQVFVEWRYTFDTRNNQLVSIAYEKGPDGPPPPGIGAQNFFGNTNSGVRNVGGFNYYEGTANNLLWWDSPGTRTPVVPGGSTLVEIKLLNLLSVVKKPNGTYCKCYSYHVFAGNNGVGIAGNALLNPLMTQQKLQQLAVQATLIAVGLGAPVQIAAEIGSGATQLQGMAAQVLVQNPHFEGVCR